MLEEGNDTPRGDLFSYLGGHNETRLGYLSKARLSARGSGLSSSRDDRLVGATYS